MLLNVTFVLGGEKWLERVIPGFVADSNALAVTSAIQQDSAGLGFELKGTILRFDLASKLEQHTVDAVDPLSHQLSKERGEMRH